MSPAAQHYTTSNSSDTLEIRDGIIFGGFYLGLPYV